MSIKSFFAKQFAKKVYEKTQKWAKNPIETQEKVFKSLILEAKETDFGKDHNFNQIKSFSTLVFRDRWLSPSNLKFKI